MKKHIHFLLLFAFICFVQNNYAQDVPSTKGREFWFTFMPNFHNYRMNDFDQTRQLESQDSLYIFISAENAAQGQIMARDFYGNEYSWDFSITQPDDVFSISIKNELFELEGKNFGTRISNYSQNLSTALQHFKVVASRDVTVYALNKAQTTSDAATIFPVESLGENYTIVSYKSHGDLFQTQQGGVNDGRTYSQFAVVAVQNGTNIEVFPSTEVGGSTGSRKVRLNAGEVFLVQADTGNRNIDEDLTGSRIISDKPIAVFAGHQRALIPHNTTDFNSRDHLYSQMRPDESFGKQYLITPFRKSFANTIDGIDIYRIIAIRNNTVINLNNDEEIILNQGEYYENVLVQSHFVESDKPIIVAQFKGSNTLTNITGLLSSDPFMILLPPLKQYLKEYNVTNIQVAQFEQQFTEHFITLICPTEYINTIRVDGRTVNPSNFKEVENTCLSYYSMPTISGNKNIVADIPFGVYVYGYGGADSYGYVGGMQFSEYDDIIPYTSRDRKVCEGDTVQLHITDAEDILWYPADDLSCSDCPDPYVLKTSNETYYVEYSDRLGCRYLDSISINVVEQPIADAGDDVIICNDEYVELDAGTDAEIIEWSPSRGLSCTDCRYPTARPENTTKYVLKVSNGNCVSYDTLVVYVRENPEITIDREDYTICVGDSAYVNIITDNNVDVLWSPNENISCIDCFDPIVYPTVTTTYNVEAVSEDGCISLDSIVVNVNPIPDLEILQPEPICEGFSTQILTSGADTYKWTPEIGLDCYDCPNPVVTSTESRMYYLEASKSNSCTVYDSVFVEIYKKPVIQVVPQYELCKNDVVNLSAFGADNIRWYPSDNLSCNDCPEPELFAQSDITYTVIGWNENNCYDTAYVDINIKNCEITIEENIDFSRVLICNSSENTIEIINPNPSYVEIYDLIIEGNDAEAFYIDEPNKVRRIEADSALKVPVVFNPTKEGFHNAEVKIISSVEDINIVELLAEGYTTDAHFKLSNNIVNIPKDTIKFSVVSNISLLDEVKPINMTFKIKYDPYWMHFTGNSTMNNEILPDWTISSSTQNIDNRDNFYLQFDLNGNEPLMQNGELFTFEAMALLSSDDIFKPDMEVSLNEKDFCVVSTTESGEIDLRYCVSNLRKVLISNDNYNFETIGNVFDDEVQVKFTVPFEQTSYFYIYDVLGKKLIEDEIKTRSGLHEHNFDVQHLSSGQYIIEFRSGPYTNTKQFMILK